MSQTEALDSQVGTIAKQRVVRILRSRIIGGELRKGQSLPSERELSRQLSVGRTVVRQALAMLGDEGLVASSGMRLRTVAYDAPDEQSAWIGRSIALLMPSLIDNGKPAQKSQWLRFMTMGLIEHLRNHNIHAITLSSEGTDPDDARRIASCQPMGLLVPETSNKDFDTVAWASIFDEANVPVVCYGGDAALARFDRVISDHEQGSYALTKALIDRGSKRIAQFWPRPWDRYWFEARRRGYVSAMTQHGLEPLPTYEFPYTPAPIDNRKSFEYSVKTVAGFMLALLREQSPDAILLATDRDVPYASAALRLHGITSGKDVLLAGYDNYWQHCEETEFEPFAPAFTVDKCNHSVGSEMVRLLLDRINQQLPAERLTRVVRQELINSSPSAAFATGVSSAIS